MFYANKLIEEGKRQKNDLIVALGWAQMGYGYSRSDNQPAQPNFFFPVALDNLAIWFEDAHQLDSALYYAERAYVMDVPLGNHFSKSFIQLVEKNKAIRLAKAKKTVEELEKA